MSFGKDASKDSMRARVISRNWREITAAHHCVRCVHILEYNVHVRFPALVQMDAANTT